eukprot:6708182-Alexandrium_andersonii.AAC.1
MGAAYTPSLARLRCACTRSGAKFATRLVSPGAECQNPSSAFVRLASASGAPAWTGDSSFTFPTSSRARPQG